MPQRKDAKGEYRDICFPTTAEMRQAINAAVLGEYERTAQRDSEPSAQCSTPCGTRRQSPAGLTRANKSQKCGDALMRCGSLLQSVNNSC